MDGEKQLPILPSERIMKNDNPPPAFWIPYNESRATLLKQIVRRIR